ncbi:unnamed protein product [Cochlearia groenlandica]
MSSAAIVRAHSGFDELNLGRSDQTIVGRLLRFWDSKNIKKNGEFMGITLLLLDEKDNVIHGFITAARCPEYRRRLKSGSIYRIAQFEVARCATTYKITENPFLIRFIPQTTIEEVADGVAVIKAEKFMCREFEALMSLANSNLELPDVVGQIQSVQGSDLTDPRVTTRVVVRFLIGPQVVVYLSLWDDVASVFRGLLKAGNRTQSVMVVTTVNPKVFGGNLYLNSTPGTEFCFNAESTTVCHFVASVGSHVGAAYTCTYTKDVVKKKEVVSICELHKFISNSNEQTQEADFICQARVVSVIEESGWSFVSCTGCSKKLEKIGNNLRCTRCVHPNIAGVIKYRVELCVDDGSDSATFVVFDREMVKLTKQDATALTLAELNTGDGEGVPECVRNLAGRVFVFQLRVTPFNFTPNHRTFTVSSMTDAMVPEASTTLGHSTGPIDKGSSSADRNTGSEPASLVSSDVGSVKRGRKRPHV